MLGFLTDRKAARHSYSVNCSFINLHSVIIFAVSFFVIPTVVQTSGLIETREPFSTSVVPNSVSTGEDARANGFWDMADWDLVIK